MKKISLHDVGGPKKLWEAQYGAFRQAVTMQRLDELERAGVKAEAVEASRTFAHQAYDTYKGRSAPKRYGFVFAIPTRITRRYEVDTSEAREFMPVVDYVTHDVAQILLSDMPPCVLDEYYDSVGNVIGAIVFVPLFLDMAHDIKSRVRTYLRARKIMKQTSQFIRKQLRPDIVGLGATLPKVTRFGADVSRYGLRTTTGHGGTVYLIYRMFRSLRQLSSHGTETVGIVGAGAIGASSAAILLHEHPNINIVMYDIRPSVLERVVSDLNHTYGARCHAAASNDEVLQSSSIIISAITSRIHLSSDVSLVGKVVIDDSQPGSFDRDEVERRGGSIVWVVGQAPATLMRRHTQFRFGDKGLASPHDVWGCEAEVAAIWRSKQYHLAIHEAVTPKSALAVGELLEHSGVKRAPWQAFGGKVELRE